MSGNESIVTQLSALRQKLGLSVMDVGDRSALGGDMLERCERGDTLPTLDALQQWAGALGQRLSLVPVEAAPAHGIRINWENRHLSVSGKTIRLTPMEWSILDRLAWAPGHLVTHRQLFKHIYGTDRDCRAQSTAVRVRISKLRQKLPLAIEARWGQGYLVEGIEPSGQPGTAPTLPRLVDIRPVAAERDEPKPARAALPSARDAEFVAMARPRGEIRPPARAPQLLRASEPVLSSARIPAPPRSACRTEELDSIERFLAERGVTRCPNVGTMEREPLPSLVWDKIKRKWVRPVGGNEAQPSA